MAHIHKEGRHIHSTGSRRLWCTILAVAVIVAAIGARNAPADEDPRAARPFTSGVIGDMPYTEPLHECALMGFVAYCTPAPLAGMLAL